MHQFQHIAVWLAFVFVAAIVAFVSEHRGHRQLCLLTLFGMLGSAVGFVGVLLMEAFHVRVWLMLEQQVSASLRQFSAEWYSLGREYAPLFGMTAGAVLGIVFAYAFRHKIPA